LLEYLAVLKTFHSSANAQGIDLLYQRLDHDLRRHFFPKLAFPFRDYNASQTIADDVHRRSGHVHKRINAENDVYGPHWQVEAAERCHEDHQACAWNTGNALAR